jgi:hypothetical protein
MNYFKNKNHVRIKGFISDIDYFPAGPQSSPVPARILPVANQAPIKLRACHAGYRHARAI